MAHIVPNLAHFPLDLYRTTKDFVHYELETTCGNNRLTPVGCGLLMEPVLFDGNCVVAGVPKGCEEYLMVEKLSVTLDICVAGFGKATTRLHCELISRYIRLIVRK